MPPIQEDIPEQDRDAIESSHTQPPNSHTPPTVEDLEKLQQEAQRWENYKAIQQKIIQLQQESKALHHELPSERHRKSASRSPDQRNEIKIKDIPLFSLDFTLQKRENWLADLRYTFEGAPWKYRTDNQKILAAIGHMDSACRQRWHRYIEEKVAIEDRETAETWLHFKEWTITLLRNSATLRSDVMSQLERAHQRFGQDPREFHAYLDTLEQHFPRRPEDDRALQFFAKLLPELKRYIQEHIIAMPTTREEMVAVATHYWNLSSYSRKRKTESWDSSDSKTRRRNGPNLRQFNKESLPKRTRDGTDRIRKTLRCYICDSPDHLANKCPQKATRVQEARTTPIRRRLGKA